jgi:hypothetical protein
MTMEERMAGFDARELWVPPAKTWPSARRERFLFRPDVERPLSVDPTVWPSIFETDAKPEHYPHFGYQLSWADLAELQRAAGRRFQSGAIPPFRTVAITLFLGDYCARDKVPWESIVPPTDPEAPNPSWKLAGYDVGDAWSLSVLSNAGFRPGLDDADALRAQWGPYLNAYHLLDDLDAAIAFKHMSDQRAGPDHAPTFVFGLRILA